MAKGEYSESFQVSKITLRVMIIIIIAVLCLVNVLFCLQSILGIFYDFYNRIMRGEKNNLSGPNKQQRSLQHSLKH